MNWVTPTLVLIVVAVGTAVKYLVHLSSVQYGGLLLNLVGTVLLASAFEPHIPPHGNGGWWDSLKFAVRNFPEYGSPPAFDFIRFYIGLLFLIAGIILTIAISDF